MRHRFTRRQREYLKQLVIDVDVQRLTESESLAYIQQKLKASITPSYLYRLKGILRRGIGLRLDKLRRDRTAYLGEFFKRIDEMQKYQQELWAIYYLNRDNGLIQVNCIRELHQVSVTLTHLYEVLPQYTREHYAPENTVSGNNQAIQAVGR